MASRDRWAAKLEIGEFQPCWIGRIWTQDIIVLIMLESKHWYLNFNTLDGGSYKSWTWNSVSTWIKSKESTNSRLFCFLGGGRREKGTL